MRELTYRKPWKVCNDHAPVIITRKSESPVVMISLEDYQAMEETAYLLRSPANARRLLESIVELEAGNGAERDSLNEGDLSSNAWDDYLIAETMAILKRINP